MNIKDIGSVEEVMGCTYKLGQTNCQTSVFQLTMLTLATFILSINSIYR